MMYAQKIHNKKNEMEKEQMKVADCPAQTIAKPNVRRSIFFWFKKEFSVLTIEECLSLRLEFSHNIYGDSINQMNCRSVWHNYKGKSYRCDSLYGVS